MDVAKKGKYLEKNLISPESSKNTAITANHIKAKIDKN